MAEDFDDLALGKAQSDRTVSFIQTIKTSSKRKNAILNLNENCFPACKKTKTTYHIDTVETQDTLLDVEDNDTLPLTENRQEEKELEMEMTTRSELPTPSDSSPKPKSLNETLQGEMEKTAQSELSVSNILPKPTEGLQEERKVMEQKITKCDSSWSTDEGFFCVVPCELLYFKIFLLLPISSLGSVFRVRKRWSKASGLEMFWKEYVLRNIPLVPLPRPQHYKPPDRDWKWVVQSHVPVPSSVKGFCGVGKAVTDGTEYKGDWVNGERTGRGVIQLSQDFFLGDFLNGVANGKGAYFWADGNRFEGDYRDGWRTGVGTFIWANGHKYVGQWEADTKNGRGCYYWPNGNWYEGNFSKDQRTGSGVFHWKNGDVYIGQFRHGLKHGKGSLIWTNGDKYEGEYVDDKRHGKGRYTWAYGDQYEGEYMDDQRNGVGVYRFSDGNIYVGQHFADVQEGQGVFQWNNGNKYEGGFHDNKRAGEGTFTEKNGHVIKGQWHAGLPVNSEGKFSIPEVVERLHPLVRDAIKNNMCTYTVTGHERYGQLLYETKEMDDRPHGVCIVCAVNCVPRNGVKYYDKEVKFGGNFYCDCGAGDDPNSPCYAFRGKTGKQV